MIRLIVALIIVLLSACFAYGDEYTVRNQGKELSCSYFAAVTYLDCIGYDVSSPSIGYRTNGGDYPGAFSYYAKEVDGLTASKIPQGDIDFWLSCHYPVYAVLLVHKADWVDGDIEVTPEYNFESKHCAVLIGKKDGYYIGVNSWGTSWGYNGLFHLYNLRIVGSALILSSEESVLF